MSDQNFQFEWVIGSKGAIKLQKDTKTFGKIPNFKGRNLGK